MKHEFTASYENVTLRPLQVEDIEKLRIWRNNPNNTKYIRQIGVITPEMQNNWFQEYLEDDDIYTFAICETKELNRMVGSVALYNFRGKTAEYGKIMVGDEEAHGRGIGRKAIMLCLHIGFAQLALENIDAVVHEENAAAIKIDKQAGFTIVGKHPYSLGGNELEILAQRESFYQINSFLTKV